MRAGDVLVRSLEVLVAGAVAALLVAFAVTLWNGPAEGAAEHPPAAERPVPVVLR